MALNMNSDSRTTSERKPPESNKSVDRMGFLEHSSGVLWDKFISQGAGAYPLIIGYEISSWSTVSSIQKPSRS